MILTVAFGSRRKGIKNMSFHSDMVAERRGETARRCETATMKGDKVHRETDEMVTFPKMERGEEDENRSSCIKSFDQTEDKAKVILIAGNAAVTELLMIAVEQTLKVRADKAAIKKSQVKECLEIFAEFCREEG